MRGTLTPYEVDFLAPTSQHHFDATRFAAFYDHVCRVDDSTITAPIHDVADVELDRQGRRQLDGYRLTYLALRQLCGCLSAGLTTFVCDVAGIHRRRGRVDSVVSPELAIKAINSTLRLRFLASGGIYGRQLIQNTLDETVDGIVGMKYRYLAHRYLVEATRDMLSTVAMPASFHAAGLAGRRLSLSYRCGKPLHTLPDGTPIYQGYYFNNSEAGECGVHAALVLYLGDGDLRCMSKLAQLAHTGRNFTKKLGHLLQDVLVSAPPAEKIADHTSRLISQKLQLDTSGRRAHVVSKLVAVGVDYPFAKSLIESLAFVEVYPLSRKQPAPQRTHMDLVNHLIKEAAKCAPKARETLEQAAFRILLRRPSAGSKS